MPCQLLKQRGTVTMSGNCSLNYLQQLLSNIPHLGLQHTPVAPLHTSETPHMEHAGRSWLYMNTMQIFFHTSLTDMQMNELLSFNPVVNTSDCSTWAKKTTSLWNTCFCHPCKAYHHPGKPSLSSNPGIIVPSDLFQSPCIWALYRNLNAAARKRLWHKFLTLSPCN